MCIKAHGIPSSDDDIRRLVAAIVAQAIRDGYFQDYESEPITWLKTTGLAWLDTLGMEISYQSLRKWLSASQRIRQEGRTAVLRARVLSDNPHL